MVRYCRYHGNAGALAGPDSEAMSRSIRLQMVQFPSTLIAER